jgi:glycerophosphoryl diester phosphodiesterase
MLKWILTTFVFYLGFCQVFASPQPPTWEKFPVIGHRGFGKSHTPQIENTLFAIEEALKKGVSAIEFDVQLTADGEVVLMHDPMVDRTTNGTGCVSEMSYEQIARLSMKDESGSILHGRPDVVFPNLKVPKLRDALILIKKYDMPKLKPFIVDMHIKYYDDLYLDYRLFDRDRVIPESLCSPTRYQELVDSILKITDDLEMTQRVFFTSFAPEVLEQIQKAKPEAMVGHLMDYDAYIRIKLASEKGYTAVVPNFNHFGNKELQLVKKYGLQLYFWFADHQTPQDFKAASAISNGIITDKVIESLQLRDQFATQALQVP